MAQKLSSLFFSTAKRIARLQRQVLKIASGAAVAKPRKQAARTKTGTPKEIGAKLAPGSLARTGSSPPASSIVPTGSGIWENFIHKTPPSHTELLGRLAYSLYRPSVRSIAGLPLVVMLHGCQQSAHEMALGSRMNRLADSKGFVVVYPQQAKRVQALRCWRWFQPDASHGFAEADAIAGLVRTLVARYKLDRSRVYVAGMSAGAGMAGLVALRHPGVFAAVAMHSGTVLGDAASPAAGLRTMRRGTLGDPASLLDPLLTDTKPFLGMPAIILQGERDHVVAPQNASQLAQQFVSLNWAAAGKPVLDGNAGNGKPLSAEKPALAPKVSVLAAGTSREYNRADFILGKKLLVRLCMIKRVGHAWSGGDVRLKFNAKEGPRACTLIWQFFEMHRREG